MLATLAVERIAEPAIRSESASAEVQQLRHQVAEQEALIDLQSTTLSALRHANQIATTHAVRVQSPAEATLVLSSDWLERMQASVKSVMPWKVPRIPRRTVLGALPPGLGAMLDYSSLGDPL